MIQQVPVRVALVVPHSLDPIGQVDPHCLVTGQGQLVNLYNRPPRKGPLVVKVTLAPGGCAPGTVANARS